MSIVIKRYYRLFGSWCRSESARQHWQVCARDIRPMTVVDLIDSFVVILDTVNGCNGRREPQVRFRRERRTRGRSLCRIWASARDLTGSFLPQAVSRSVKIDQISAGDQKKECDASKFCKPIDSQPMGSSINIYTAFHRVNAHNKRQRTMRS